MTGVAALFSIFDDVAPPGIFQRRRHMVRHNVEDQAEASLLQSRHHAVETFAPADRRIDLVGVGNIITVGGTGRGGEDRRGIEMTYAQALEIRHERCGAIEGHAIAELDAVGRGRDHAAAHAFSKLTMMELWESSLRRSG
ncbi:hypothetical protein D3C73_883710 [compost metagenome]